MIQLAALLRKNIDVKAHDAATSPHNLKPLPTAAQRNAGNYPKGKMRVGGLNISIENPAGSVRNPKWHPMSAHYGYVRGSGAQADGGLLDVFVKPNTPHDWSGNVFVIDQAKPEGGHDEFKCMIGWEDEASARRAYLNHYPHGWENNIRYMRVMALPEFKDWMKPAAKSLIHGLLRKEFDEAQHPRDENGRFGEGAGKPQHSPEQLAIWAKERKDRERKQSIESAKLREEEKKLNDRNASAFKTQGSAVSFTASELSSIEAYYLAGDRFGAMAEGRNAAVNAIERECIKRGITIDKISSSDSGKGKSIYVKTSSEIIRVSDHELPITPERETNRAQGLKGRWDREIITTDWRSTSVTDYMKEISNNHNKSLAHPLLHKALPKRIKAMPKAALKAKQKALAATLAKYLKAQGKRIAAQIAAHAVEKVLLQTILRKALTPAQIIAAIKLKDWDALVNEHMTPEIEVAFKAAGMFAGAQLGVDEPITNLVNDRAVKYAAERSAELVTNIDDSTRDMLRATVADAIENGMASRDLAKAIEENRAFSPERADLIASYELGQALEEGNMAMWKESGVVTGKAWVTAEDEIVSDDCQANAEQGVIPIDEEFQSGDMQPLAHPMCRCSSYATTEPIE